MGNWATNVLVQNELQIKIVAASIMALVLWKVMTRELRGRSKSRPKLPPGPQNLPIVGVMFSMEKNIGQWYQKMAGKFGKIFYYRLGSHGIIVVCSAEGAEEILKTKDALFANRPVNGLLKSASKYLGFDASDTMFASLTENQKNLKRLLISHFFTASKLALFENMRRREGAFMVQEIQRQIDARGTIQVSVTLLDTLINLISSLILGRRYSEASESDVLKYCPEIIRTATSLFLKLNLGDLFPTLAWADIQGLDKEFKQFKQLCEKVFGQIIKEHKEERRTNKNHKDRDFVDVLLTLHEEGKITEKAIPGSMDDMLVGGTDVTAVIIEWALLELAKNPDCLAKLQKEMDDVIGKDRRVEESDFPKLPYLQAVVQESFRLHSPAPCLVPHFTPKATTLQGFYVPANTTVFVNLRAITRDPLYWKNPEKFDPERFVNRESINLTEGNVFGLFPFGSGRRKCPAATMGHLMVQMYISTLVHAFDWSPPPGRTVDDIDSTESIGVLSRPETPLELSAKPRLAPGIYTP